MAISDGNPPELDAASAAQRNPTQPTLPGLPLPPGTLAHIQITTHPGLLPLPQYLAEYEKLHAGATKWMFDEARLDGQHTRTMEAKTLAYQGRDNLLHRVLPFTLVALFLISSVALAIFANPVVGGISFVTTIGAVLTAYLKGIQPPK